MRCAAPQAALSHPTLCQITTVPSILNISCYKFVSLPDCEAQRELLAQRAADLALKGTVLLAEEGINFFLAGPAEAVHAWVDALRGDPRFADVQPKESWSQTVPTAGRLRSAPAICSAGCSKAMMTRAARW
jgi:predicted sulfurtransferase